MERIKEEGIIVRSLLDDGSTRYYIYVASSFIVVGAADRSDRSGKESELLSVLLGQADEALPLLGVSADGLAELGDDLKSEMKKRGR